MNRKTLQKKIRTRKYILNFLLTFMKRNNPLIINLSQNLDYFIQKEQSLRYKKYSQKTSNAKVEKVA